MPDDTPNIEPYVLEHLRDEELWAMRRALSADLMRLDDEVVVRLLDAVDLALNERCDARAVEPA